jgi:hypothetical protein
MGGRFQFDAPYLTNPNQPSIRTTNYTEIGTNQHANSQINGPCVYGGTSCTQIAPTKGVCEDNSGVWWGAGATDPSTAGIPAAGLPLFCDVTAWQHDHGQTVASNIYPLKSYSIRNAQYKLVVSQFQSYDASTDACAATTTNEFYEINEDVPKPELDTANANLLASGQPPLTPVQQENYNVLTAQLKALRSLQPFCTGDINLDRVVNNLDVQQWSMLEALSEGNSSWADINQDGLTNGVDMNLILQDFGPCPN